MPRRGRFGLARRREQRPRNERATIDDKGFRAALIRAFSRHAKLLSPPHGPTPCRFDPNRWFAILDYGFKADPADAVILEALGNPNILTSVGEQFGSGGKRNLGFTEAQAAVILHHAKRTCQRLGLSEPQP
jgi:hypothetical protein